MLLAGCGRIGFGLGGDPPPADGTPADGVTDGMPGDSMTDPMMSVTGLEDTAAGSQDSNAATVRTEPVSHGANKLLVVAVHWFGALTAIAALTDGAGNIYQPLNRIDHPSGGSVQLWFANNTLPNPSNSVTATFTLPTPKARILVHEYPAVQGKSGEGTGFGSGVQATTSFVGAAANSLVVASCFTPNGSTSTFTAGNNFALGAGISGDSQMEDRVLATAGSATGAMGYTPAANYVIAFAVFDR